METDKNKGSQKKLDDMFTPQSAPGPSSSSSSSSSSLSALPSSDPSSSSTSSPPSVNQSVTSNTPPPMNFPETIQHSPDSPLTRAVASRTQPKPLITYERNSKGKLEFGIGEERPQGNLPKEKGDHSTAYTIFPELILAAMDDAPLKEIPAMLQETVDCFLQEDETIFSLKTRLNTALMAYNHSRQKRKNITSALRNVTEVGLDEEVVTVVSGKKAEFKSSVECLNLHKKKIYVALKEQEEGALAKEISQSARIVISKINQLEDIAFPKSRILSEKSKKQEKQKKEGKKEIRPPAGQREKQAKQAIRALNQLIAIIYTADKAKQDECYVEFRSDRKLIRALEREFGIVVTSDAGGVVSLQTVISNFQSNLSQHADKLGQFIEWLFDYKYVGNRKVFLISKKGTEYLDKQDWQEQLEEASEAGVTKDILEEIRGVKIIDLEGSSSDASAGQSEISEGSEESEGLEELEEAEELEGLEKPKEQEKLEESEESEEFEDFKILGEPKELRDDKLFYISARHIAFIFAAFRNFNKMPKEFVDAAINSFLRSVFDEQGWNNLRVSRNPLKMLDLETFRAKVYEGIENFKCSSVYKILHLQEVSVDSLPGSNLFSANSMHQNLFGYFSSVEPASSSSSSSSSSSHDLPPDGSSSSDPKL